MWSLWVGCTFFLAIYIFFSLETCNIVLLKESIHNWLARTKSELEAAYLGTACCLTFPMFSKEAGDGVDIGCGTNRLATCVHYYDNTLFPTSVFHLLQLYNKDSKLVDEDLSVCQGSVWFVTSKWRVPESMNVERVYSDFCSSLCKDTLPCIQSWPSDAFRHRLGIVFTFFFFSEREGKVGCLDA